MQSIGTLHGRKRTYQVEPHELLPTTDMVGIELELEGEFDHEHVNGWDIHGDGSLRDGVEYVFAGPAGGASAVRRLENMARFIRQNEVAPTFRCSTHIHLDVGDLDAEQLKRLVMTYALFEDVMFDHCDLSRRFSNFCTPYFNNNTLVERASRYLHDFRHTENRTAQFEAFPKYSAFNLQPIIRLDTVEFRGSGALTTLDELIGLTQRMLHLKRTVREVGAADSTEYLRTINALHPRDVFQTGLRDNYVRDQELADICYSNALQICNYVGRENNIGLRPNDNWAGVFDEFHGQPMPQPRPRGDQRDTFMVRSYNEQALHRIGLMVPNDRSWKTARKVIRAINGMVGANINPLDVVILEMPDLEQHLFEDYIRN